MGLIVIETPEALNYTGNPFGFILGTDTPAETILWVEIWDGGNLLATIRKEAIQGAFLSADFQLNGIFAASVDMPIPGGDTDTVKELTIKAQFTTGEKPQVFTTAPFLERGVYGAHKKIDYATGRRALDFYNIMTDQTERGTTPAAKTFVQIGAKEAAFNPFFNVEIKYKDGSIYEHPTPFNLGTVAAFSTKTFDISWDLYNYGGIDPGGAGKDISRVLLRFNIEAFDLSLKPVKAKHKREFHWVNLLGGLDSAVFTGAFKEKTEIKREISERGLKQNFAIYPGQFSQFSQEAAGIYSGNSGYMSETAVKQAAGILFSPQVWERTAAGVFIPVLVIGDGGQIIDENSRLFSFDFEYRYAFNF